MFNCPHFKLAILDLSSLLFESTWLIQMVLHRYEDSEPASDEVEEEDDDDEEATAAAEDDEVDEKEDEGI